MVTYHRNLTGADLHYARAIVGSGTPVASVSASISGELYLNKTTQEFYAAGTAGTSYWNLLGGTKNHAVLTNLMYASSGHIGFASSGHIHSGVYSTTGHSHLHNNLTNLSYSSAGHTGFASSGHIHSGVYSTTGHSHVYSSLTGLPLIRTYTGSFPLNVTGSTISIQKVTTSTSGYLSSTDWNVFNSKQVAGNYATVGYVQLYSATVGHLHTGQYSTTGHSHLHNTLTNLSFASSGHIGFSSTMHTHAGVYSTTAHTHSIYNTVVMEDRRGTACTGSTGAISRVLTLTNTAPLVRAEMLAINGVWLHQPDYAKSTAASNTQITFTNAVWDEDYIRVIYFT